jgi:hypothetical protein
MMSQQQHQATGGHQQALSPDKLAAQQSLLYHTAMQSLQTYCLSKADQLKRTSVEPTERLVQNVNGIVKK